MILRRRRGARPPLVRPARVDLEEGTIHLDCIGGWDTGHTSNVELAARLVAEYGFEMEVKVLEPPDEEGEVAGEGEEEPETLWTYQSAGVPLPIETPVKLPSIGRGHVDIILVVTGWTALEREAIHRAGDIARELGGAVVVVQNDEASFKRTRSWRPPKSWGWPATWSRRVRRVYHRDRSFGAACDAGAAKAKKAARWLLFTQADVMFDTQAVLVAASFADHFDAIVGPSGGMVAKHGQLTERGRQTGEPSEGIWRVDWIAGYWLLIGREALKDAGGWTDTYALYYEDPDLCLRAWQRASVRSVIAPDLRVDHERGTTIRALFSQEEREAVQAASRAIFSARWGVA